MSQSIHWYPGHMEAAVRMLRENIRSVDAVIYVLDARVAGSCINPYFEEILGGKPRLYVLNKSDLANSGVTAKWLRYFASQGIEAVEASLSAQRKTTEILARVTKLVDEKIQRRLDKGVKFIPKTMVVGVSNSGKSTIINSLSKSSKAITGDKPGVTRGKQWVRVQGVMDLLDTPGVLPKKYDSNVVSSHLAYVGNVRDQVVDAAELSLGLIAELNAIDPKILQSRYNITAEGAPLEVLEQIAKARGCMARNNEFDYDRAAQALIDDFRKCRLGRISLETPDTFFSIINETED